MRLLTSQWSWLIRARYPDLSSAASERRCDDLSMPDDATLPLPDFVHWSIFPFVGEFQVRPIEPPRDADAPRDGEPGGAPCRACAAPDDDYLWVDDHWRVSAPIPAVGRAGAGVPRDPCARRPRRLRR